MSISRKDKVIRNFDQNADRYEGKAALQDEAAKKLAALLPNAKTDCPKILEIGCGTGFLSGQLFKKYPNGFFHITDFSEEMLRRAHEKYACDNARFFIMDGENPDCGHHYDLIVSAMTFHWFDNPLASLKKLSRLGPVYYSIPGSQNFREWHQTTGGRDAIMNVNWPGVFAEEFIEKDYGSVRGFMRMLKETGVSTPSENYNRLKAKSLKDALVRYQRNFAGKATWHIIYGKMQKT